MKRRTAERNLQNKTGSNNESKTTIMTNVKHGDRGKRTQKQGEPKNATKPTNTAVTKGQQVLYQNSRA